MPMSVGMPSDAVEHQGLCRDLWVKASTRTGSADAKQVDFRAGSASIKDSQCRSYWCYWGRRMQTLGLYVRWPQAGVFPRAFPSSSQSAASLL